MTRTRPGKADNGKPFPDEIADPPNTARHRNPEIVDPPIEDIVSPDEDTRSC